MNESTLTPLSGSKKFRRALEEAGLNVSACYQCGRCSAGCPLATFYDLLPMEIIRMCAYGMEEEVMTSHTIWLCASCETCTTRCPNDIDIAGTMDFLRQWSVDRGYEPAEPNIVAFHRSFLHSVRRGGRTYELGMIGEYKLRSGDWFGDFKLGMRMFGKGKLKLIPPSIRGKKDVRKIFARTTKEK